MANRKDSKGRVLKTGEYQRPNGTYEYKFKDSLGKRRSVYAENLKELREKEKEIQKLLEFDWVDFSKRDVTLRELIEQREHHINSVKETTKRNRSFYIESLKRYPILNRKVKDITPLEARNFVVELNKSYADRTVANLFQICKAAVQYGMENGILVRNPFDFTLQGLLSGKKKKDPKVLSDREFESLIKTMAASKHFDWYIPHFVFLRETGLRISEFSGLRLQDIDWEKRTIQINYQVVKLYRKGLPPKGPYYSSLKTKNSNAILPLSPAAFDSLQRIVSKCSETAVLTNENGEEPLDGFFVLSKKQHVFEAITWNREFKTIQDYYNSQFPEHPLKVHPHTLRHSMVTGLLNEGMSVVGAKKMARHSNIQTTLDIYTHLSDAELMAEANKIFSKRR